MISKASGDFDPTVRRLVDQLNAFPGVVTFSSCGGHREPLTPSQRPLGEFEVNFNVYPLLGGWRSLELIASALVESEDRNSLKLTLWSVGGGTSVNFELEGRRHADPDALATVLSQMRELFDDEVVDESD